MHSEEHLSNESKTKEKVMLSEEALYIPELVHPLNSYTLSRRVAAIRLTRGAHDSRGKLGQIVQLQPGTRLDRCGSGYNERTIKVHSEGDFYFVFLQDLADTGENAS
jgi:hypothetical protein